MLIFAVNHRLNIHDFRMRTSMSILPVDFFFACGCRAGILLDFQTIIERGPEIFTGEPGEIDEDGWHYPITG